jgi:hypothetical protein
MTSPPPTLEQIADQLGGRRRATEQFLGFSARRQAARGSITSAPTSPIAAPLAGALPPVAESAGPILPPFPIDDPANPLRPRTPSVQSRTRTRPQSPITEGAPTGADAPRGSEEVRFLHAMESITNVMTAPAKPARTKVREPDTFDGSDVTKLRPFLVQCRLNFIDRPSAFASDETKVNYALSFLKGTALNWFEPYLLEGGNLPPPLFLSDYAAFCAELHANFGPLDPVGSAESKLETLRMRNDTDISKYVVTFNQLATQVNWDSNALRHAFYCGLSDRIKDKIWPVGKPADLLGMKELAQNIDAWYWERKAEIARDAAHNSSWH